MIFSPRIKTKVLAGLCSRMAIALEAGLDLRRMWTRETEQAANRDAKRHFGAVKDIVASGGSMTEGFNAAGEYFPHLFREMVSTAEQTGHLSEVFSQLAEHYGAQLRLRRSFLAAISWPLIELVLALVVVGIYIVAIGVINAGAEGRVDPLGLGLSGGTGLLVYCVILGVFGVLGWLAIGAARTGVFSTSMIQRAVLRVPVLGAALRTMVLARLAWSLQLTMGIGMEVSRALRLGLLSTRNAAYSDQVPLVQAEIRAGRSIHDALSAAGEYPDDFLDIVAVGEESGRLPESLQRLASDYHHRAETAIKTLTMLAGVAVWLMIAMFIITLIFQLFGSYVATINKFL